MVLVSIVGDFHSSVLPIFYEFKEKITKHILVYDDFKNDVQRAKEIKKGIETFKKQHSYAFETLHYKLDEDSLESLQKCAIYLLSHSLNPKNLYINTTDGLSTLSSVLNQELLEKGVNFLAYDMYDNEYNILNKNSLQKHKIENSLDIKNHFLLKGYGVIQSDIGEFAKTNKKLLSKLFQKYADSYSELLKERSYDFTVKQLPQKYERMREILSSMGLKKHHVKDAMISGTLFEAYVYNLVADLNVDDIEIGLKIFRKYKNSKILNEFDILLMKDNHLHMIECKYRNFVKLDDLIYKYIAISDIIDEDGKMILVTKKKPKYNTRIDSDINEGRTYKRGLLSNITVLGDIATNPAQFTLNTQAIFNLKEV